jgi:hypothetical protein
MSQTDFVAPVKAIKQKTVIEVNELIRHLHKIIKERGYSTLIEQSHKESTDDNGDRSISFYWFAKKKVSNYVKLVLEISFDASVKNITIEKENKKTTVQEGSVSITIGGYTQKDYEDEWGLRKESSFRKVFREFYDKIIDRDRMGAKEKEFLNDIKLITNEMKAYLKMHRID